MKPAVVLSLLLAATLGFGQSLDELTKLQEGRTGRSSSSNPDWKGSNFDYKFLKPGETLELANVKGPGKLTHLWMTILPSEPGYSRLMTIRIYWDGEKSPSVECPIGDFFGVGHGVDSAFDSLPIRDGANGKARNCYWVMPFRKSAKVTVSNDGSEGTWGFYFNVDFENCPVAKDAPYFHASYRQEHPAKKGNYLIADIEGKGHYVGTVLSVHSVTPGWWGEGDEFAYIDGEKEPSIRGTGLEDYFCEAWGLRKGGGLYSGTSYWEGGSPGARTTCYRWHIPDPIRFTKSLRFEIEHKGVAAGPDGKDLGNNNEREDDYSSVAFWYQLEPHKPFAPLPPGSQRLIFSFKNMIEGESLVPTAKPTGGNLVAEKSGGSHGGSVLRWECEEAKQELVLTFTVPKDNDYQLLLLCCKYWDGATFEVLMDGQEYARHDFFSSTWDTNQEFFTPVRRLKAGEHKLTFKNVGKNPEAMKYGLVLDGICVWAKP